MICCLLRLSFFNLCFLPPGKSLSCSNVLILAKKKMFEIWKRAQTSYAIGTAMFDKCDAVVCWDEILQLAIKRA